MPQTVKNLPAMQEMKVRSLGREDPWRREWLPTPVLVPRELRGAWQATVRGVTEGQIPLSDSHFTLPTPIPPPPSAPTPHPVSRLSSIPTSTSTHILTSTHTPTHIPTNILFPRMTFKAGTTVLCISCIFIQLYNIAVQHVTISHIRTLLNL